MTAIVYSDVGEAADHNGNGHADDEDPTEGAEAADDLARDGLGSR